MIKSLYSGASGMRAQQLNIDNISNNLANVNTDGYKKMKVEFQDLIYQTIRSAGTKTGQESSTPVELQLGVGVRPVSTSKDFSQGTVTQTGNPLDVAIYGDGFFRITKDDGGEAYTRDGHFKISADGTLVTNDGFIVEPQITIPDDTEAILIGDNGIVSVLLSGETIPQELGQLELAKFINPNGLKNIGQNLFTATEASGDAVTGTPMSVGFGSVKQAYTETSNVDLVQEMVDMITAQRAYDLNSKSIKTADEMLQSANQLKR
ncbi:MAG: flagellar basal-body rod protein FlgG [Candidatus Delongbacteria bacterium]|nr:flagellar basal-body rod protein FlgG [Candidatus Delongbacteria bacterium]MBN2833348.1 flagellar basal-body rod protein FlgG [Candidatus Delongbacteria bacterium]